MATESVFTIDELIRKLQRIKVGGWVANARPKNDGRVGNTLEDLLGVKENNLRIPDYGEYELKARRADTTSLVTLFHSGVGNIKRWLENEVFDKPLRAAGLRIVVSKSV